MSTQRRGIGTTATVAIVVVIIAVAAVAYYAYKPVPPTQQSSTTPTTSAHIKTVNVNMPLGAGGTQRLNFVPEKIIVVVGVNNTVRWTNHDSAAHTVTGSTFDSGGMAVGANFTHTFDGQGNYSYRCSYHPWMMGSVLVRNG
ncbi:MAG: hypothetical protein HY296_00615 [Thaumarchaeota archaeon]|nr:hypothetical protein [Nitrososphaerota archaeon]